MVIGIWGTILTWAVETGKLAIFLGWELGYQVAFIAGIITAHLLLLVLFYAMFRGGIVRMCRVLYKNRLVAKKYEDFSTLRWLMGITLLGIYVVVFALLTAILPGVLVENFIKWWLETIVTFGPGEWFLYIGFVIFCVIGFFFFMFFLWNHGVYFVLRRVKRIEEEMEVDEEIRRELLQGADEESLQAEYRKETGKIPQYRGRDTRAYKNWKKKYGVKS